MNETALSGPNHVDARAVRKPQIGGREGKGKAQGRWLVLGERRCVEVQVDDVAAWFSEARVLRAVDLTALFLRG